jgi:hypothetical protein
VRIVKWQYKLVFAVVAYGVTRLIGVAIGPLPAAVGDILGPFLFIAPYLVGARLFRGPDESLEPRPWWRMTARPALSKVLGILFAAIAGLFTLLFVLGPVVNAALREQPVATLIGQGLSVLSQAVLAFLYLTTYRKLKPLFPEPEVEPVPEPRPMWDTSGPSASE